MAFPLSHTQIAACLRCPDAAVSQNWPLLEKFLSIEAIYSDRTAIALLATVAIETAYKFEPIHEVGSHEYFRKMYDVTGEHQKRANDLGNLDPGDGVIYHGRGFIQITGKANYARYGQRLNLNLVANPDGALNPVPSAHIAALFFKDHGLHILADKKDWQEIRRRVNGGHNGLKDFMECVNNLDTALERSRQQTVTITGGSHA